jgi:hypothetical protein
MKLNVQKTAKLMARKKTMISSSPPLDSLVQDFKSDFYFDLETRKFTELARKNEEIPTEQLY